MIYYADTDVCEHHLTQIRQTCTRDLDEFLSSIEPKIAVFHIPFPWEGGYGDLFVGRITRALEQCQHIYILCSELHNRTIEFIRSWDYPNVSYLLCGYLNRRPEHSHVYTWMDWLIRTTDFYKRNPQVLDALTPYSVKPKTFDVLLGQPRTHRDMIYNYITKNNLNDQVIMTYMRDFSQGLYDHDFNEISFQQRSNSEWQWDSITAPQDPLHFTIEPVEYCGEMISLSQIIPTNIYNETAYTVVAETNYMNAYTFFTEKIVKPILAERLFVVFSGQHYLRNLHNAGFKTFDCVIDESYDEEPDVTKRYAMIFEQMRYLINEPQENIYKEIKSITEHNRHHMMQHDWNGEYFKVLQSLLLSHTKQN
jgi:hypothetical protein